MSLRRPKCPNTASGGCLTSKAGHNGRVVRLTPELCRPNACKEGSKPAKPRGRGRGRHQPHGQGFLFCRVIASS
jgi:hypothetical protein